VNAAIKNREFVVLRHDFIVSASSFMGHRFYSSRSMITHAIVMPENEKAEGAFFYN